MTTGEKIKMLRIEKGYTQGELASMLGVKTPAVYKYENNIVTNLKRSTIQRLADVLGTTPSYLMGFENDEQNTSVPEGFIPMPNTTKVPLVGTIACGIPILAEENIEGYIELPDFIRADFALHCKGDSMIGAGIQSGDVVYIKKTSAQPENGKIAAVRIGEEATLKRFYRDGNTVKLVAENPSIPTKVFIGEEINDIVIEGLAVGYTHKIV